jgi:hypothetical protein
VSHACHLKFSEAATLAYSFAPCADRSSAPGDSDVTPGSSPVVGGGVKARPNSLKRDLHRKSVAQDLCEAVIQLILTSPDFPLQCKKEVGVRRQITGAAKSKSHSDDSAPAVFPPGGCECRRPARD